MKGFIKITDISKNEHYINIDYIIKFSPTNEGHEGNTFIYVTSGHTVSVYQTNITPEEIIEMIDKARS